MALGVLISAVYTKATFEVCLFLSVLIREVSLYMYMSHIHVHVHVLIEDLYSSKKLFGFLFYSMWDLF